MKIHYVKNHQEGIGTRNVLVRMWNVWENFIGRMLSPFFGEKADTYPQDPFSFMDLVYVFFDLLKSRKRLMVLFTVFIILAPIAYLSLIYLRPAHAMQWWADGGNAWKQRKQLTVTNNSTANLSSGATVTITVDTKSLYDAYKLQSDCDDLRIVYQPSSSTTTEATRHIVYPSGTTCATSTNTKVNFKLQAALNTTVSTTDYFVYYNNTGASTPSSTDNAFDTTSSIDAMLVCPFDGSTTCAASETPSTETGALRYNGSKSALNFDGINDSVSGLTDPGVFSTKNFTYEMWVYVTKYGTGQGSGLIGKTSGAADRIMLGTSGAVQFVNDSGSTNKSCGSVSLNTWTHIAVTGDGTSVHIFVGGTECGSATLSGSTWTADSIGVGFNSYFHSGLIDEVRISKMNRYPANFTPSTVPFVRDSTTKHLYHFDENWDDPRNSGKAIDDSGNGNHGTISGAKYVSGLVGVDASTSNTGNVPRQSYAAHEGIHIEVGTTNKITNPSFDHSTYNTNWHQITASGQAYWRLGEASGSRADSIGSNTLTDNNTVTQATGKIGNAGQFTAANSEYLSIADNAALSTGDIDFSIGAWVYLDSKSAIRPIVVKDDLSSVREYSLIYDNTADRFVFEAWDSGNVSIGQAVANTLGSPSTATWYYIVAWHDSSANTINIQVNNGTANSTATGGSAPSDTGQRFCVGSDDCGTNFFDGRIDEVGFWKRVLTSNERTALYNAGTGVDPTNLTPTANTTAPYYKFGATSAKLVAGANGVADFVTDINPASTASHSFSFYAYDGTSGNVGGTVSTSIIKPLFQGTAQTGTFTDMGGGWWRVTYVAATTNSSNTYGVQVQTSKTVYVDGVQLEDLSAASADGASFMTASSYTDGTLGSSYAWTGTAHNSTSTRTATSLEYLLSGNGQRASGTLSMWYKLDTYWPDSGNFGLISIKDDSAGNSGYIYALSQNSCQWQSNFRNGSDVDNNWLGGCGNQNGKQRKWQFLTFTWTSGSQVLYINGSSVVTGTYTTNSTITGTGKIVIGKASATSSLKTFNGDISDLRIFDTQLTSTQVTDLYQAGLVGHAEGPQIDRAGGFDTKGDNAVSIYHMDEGYGSTTYDSSTNANNLTITGPAWETTSANLSTNRRVSLKFDGSNDYLSRSADGDFDFGTGSFSIGGWFRHPSAVSGTDMMLARYTTAGYKAYMNSSGFICFAIDDDSTWTPDDSACSTVSYADSKWHYFSAVKSGTTSITTYVDGNQVAQDATIAATATLNTGSSLYFGIDSDAASNPWDGYLDEFVFYNYARTAAQIKNDILSDPTAVLFGTNPNDPLTQGLIGYWKLDESSGNAADSSGNATTLTNTNTATFTGAKFGNGTDLESGSSQYFFAADSATLSQTGSVTVSAWIKPESVTASTDFDIIGKWDGANESYLLEQFGDEIRFAVDSSSNYQTTTAADLATGTWYHITAVYDSKAQTVIIFVNGAISASSTTGTIPSSIGDDAGRLQIGAEDSTTTAAKFYDGVVDEARIYSRALSPAEVAQLYAFASGPVGYWKMDEKTGTSANDSSGNGFTGTLTAGPTWTNGKFGSAVNFDGSDDYINVSSFTGINSAEGSMSAWIYRTFSNTVSTFQVVFDTRVDSSNNIAMFYDATNDDWDLRWKAGGTTYGNETLSADSIPQNTWTYITLTWSKSNDQVKTYINSVQQGSTVSSLGNFTGTLSSATIGQASSANYYTGKIDDVKVYNYARTAGQIIQDMNAGHPLGGSPVGSQIGYWKLDEGYGTSANDISPNSNTLTFSTATSAWTNSGKFGKAWDGNGSRYISRVDDADFDVSATDDYAISLWFKSDSATNPGAVEYLFNKANATTAGYAVYANTDGTICFGIDDDTTWSPDIATCTSADYYDGTWHHIAAIRDASGTDKIYIYIDGVQKDNDSDSTTATLANSLTMYVGDRDGTDNGDEFTGDIDEVKVYRAALAVGDVLIDFNRGSSTKLGSLSDNSTYQKDAANQEYCVPGDSTSCASPVGEWKMDEKTGTTANDTSGNANTGTLTSGPTWSTGKTGAGVNFNGTSNYISVADSTSLDATSAVSISAWMKPSGATQGSFARLIFKGDSGGTWAYGLSFDTTGQYIRIITFTSASVASIAPTTTIANRWYHVEGTYDGTTQKLYVDGVLVDSDSQSGTLANAAVLGIAAEVEGGVERYYAGDIDQVRIFNYARTAAQVAFDYNRGAPLAQYKLDECTGSTANDASGNSNTGTITIGATGTNTSTGTCASGTSTEAWNNGTTGKFNNSLDFDGTDDLITATAALNKSEGTISHWLKPSSVSGSNARVAYYESDGTGSTYNGWSDTTSILEVNTGILNSKWQVTYQDGSGGASVQYDSGVTAVAGEWVHFVFTWNRSGNLNIYINGVNKLTTSISGISYSSLTATVKQIGKVGDGTATRNWLGQIDDVRVYNYALSATQVKTVMNEGSAVRLGPQTGSP